MTIQVLLSVGGENGILVKHYLKIQISPPKIGTFQNQKNQGGENGLVFPGGENGISLAMFILTCVCFYPLASKLMVYLIG